MQIGGKAHRAILQLPQTEMILRHASFTQRRTFNVCSATCTLEPKQMIGRLTVRFALSTPCRFGCAQCLAPTTGTGMLVCRPNSYCTVMTWCVRSCYLRRSSVNSWPTMLSVYTARLIERSGKGPSLRATLARCLVPPERCREIEM